MSFNNHQIKKFSRQLILKDFGEEKQNLILKSHITFVGMGGINIPALLYLLAIGLNKLTIVDYDKVQLSNLNRQIIYSVKDVGKYKVRCVSNYLKKNYPDVNFLSLNKEINKNNCSKILKKTDIVIDGTDNWDSMLTINENCVKKNIPLLSASVLGYDGNLTLFKNNKKKHICLECIFPNPKKIELPRCETAGILGTTSGIIGTLAAVKAIEYLTNNKNSSKSTKMIFFNGKKIELKSIKINNNPKCRLIK
ncbi:MAG: Sulfur carrier protein ThiS adenylyltransferase [Alphaproteobacteria bacterium MarineAlpha5_Bin12]|nr:MAG: Sulfur carrier protein ThiS adenylyltransferase [Alphaproteobacteria bacterium MarineAlpha5_Bin12]